MACKARHNSAPPRPNGNLRSNADVRPAGKTYPLSPNDLREIFNGAPVSIWVEDFSQIKARLDDLKRNGTKNFRAYFRTHPEVVLGLAKLVGIVNINGATLRLYEASDKRQLQRGLGLVFSKESYDVFREELTALAEGRTEFSAEAITRSLKGNSRRVLLKLVVPPGYAESLKFVLVFLVDITDLKESQEELAESEAKYRTVVEFAPDALVITDAESRIVLEANQRAEGLFGRPTEKIVGAHIAELLPEDYAVHLCRAVEGHPGTVSDPVRGIAVARESGVRIPVSARSCLVVLKGRRCILMRFRELDGEHPEVNGAAPPPGAGIARSTSREEIDRLSRRERDVIALVAAGLTNRDISKRLFISVKTVETHRARIMEKLGLHRTADIVRFAIYAGLCGEIPKSA